MLFDRLLSKFPLVDRLPENFPILSRLFTKVCLFEGVYILYALWLLAKNFKCMELIANKLYFKFFKSFLEFFKTEFDVKYNFIIKDAFCYLKINDLT